MERKIRNLLVATGVLLSSAVALLPLTSYAAVTDPNHGYGCTPLYDENGKETDATENICENEGATTVVRVLIDPTIAIDMASGGDVIETAPNMVATGAISANVRSAMGYTVSLSADEPYLTNTDDDSYNILPRTTIEAGKNAWGVKKDQSVNGGATVSEYTAISTVPQLFFSSDDPADDGQDISFEVGVSTSATLPQGVYQTDVTITAAVKE